MSVILAANTTGQALPAGPGANLVLYSEHPLNAIPPSAGGNNSVALGSGSQTSTNAPNSTAIGLHSLARHPGSVVIASGRFGTSGDIQSGKYILRAHTVGVAPAELLIDGTNGTQRLSLPDDCTWSFSILVTAHRQDSIGGHAGFRFEGVIHRAAGAETVMFQGNPIKTVLARSDSSWDINITPDTTYGALRIYAQGASAKIIRWGALIETLEITN